jgi:membrane fusion protein (multidrug efflux system)
MNPDTPKNSSPNEPIDLKANNTKRNYVFTVLSLTLLIVGIVYFGYWYLHGRYFKYTNDAYVSGNPVMVTAQVPGIVTKIYVQDADFVQKNTPLVQIDPTDHEIALSLALKELAKSVRDVAELFSTVLSAKALIDEKQAILLKKVQDYERRKILVNSGSVSREDFEHAQYDMEDAQAQLIYAQETLNGLKAQVGGTTIATHPRVEANKQAVRQAFINLKRCTLLAPQSGVVSQRTVQVGKWVETSMPLLSVVPLNQMWIEANFKETQLERMRVGQPVRIRSDIYGHTVEYEGVLAGVGGGTGSAFSVIPPQNATGNWIKIVQRVPVRVDIPDQMLKQFPLRIGLSMYVTVDTRLTKGSMTAAPREKNVPRFMTDIYDDELKGVEELIQKTVDENQNQFALTLDKDVDSIDQSP